MFPNEATYRLYIKIGKEYYGTNKFQTDYDPINHSQILLVDISEGIIDYNIIGNYKLIIEDSNQPVYDPIGSPLVLPRIQTVNLYKRVYDKTSDSCIWKLLPNENKEDAIFLFTEVNFTTDNTIATRDYINNKYRF
jgi:hypothetical protein